VGFAIGLLVSLHVVSVAKRCKAAPISVSSPLVSLYCTRSLKSVHDIRAEPHRFPSIAT
jgi:hypothetical protein